MWPTLWPSIGRGLAAARTASYEKKRSTRVQCQPSASSGPICSASLALGSLAPSAWISTACSGVRGGVAVGWRRLYTERKGLMTASATVLPNQRLSSVSLTDTSPHATRSRSSVGGGSPKVSSTRDAAGGTTRPAAASRAPRSSSAGCSCHASKSASRRNLKSESLVASAAPYEKVRVSCSARRMLRIPASSVAGSPCAVIPAEAAKTTLSTSSIASSSDW
mmetsp:Transcript_4242/g.13361  ORF Transcript_4242/g.13361 Transcript_4242/m.13361 type:complete len:221 (+) Transcript_4242:683-1345(+)